MRILSLTQNFLPFPGGIAVFLHNLYLQLHRLGHHVDVLVPWTQGCEEADATLPYRVRRYASRQHLSSLVPLWETVALHRRYRYDVVFIGHFMTTHALGVLASRVLARTPYAILCHGNDMHYGITNWGDRLVGPRLLRGASLVLANSHATARRLRERGCQETVQILHPGVDTSRFRPDAEDSEIVRRYGLDGRKVILSVSRLVERKGHDRVIRALPTVVERIHNALYMIVGEGEEGPRLRGLVAELGLERQVVFAGHVEEGVLPALYSACDIFVMPAFERDGGFDYEGFGIAFSEASACGKPAIGGRSGGIADAVIDGETGLLVDPDDEMELAAAMIRLLTDGELARRIGTNGRQRVERELSWEHVGQRASRLLEEAVERSK